MSTRALGPRISMSADAYAGFLRLLLTPADRLPRMTDDVEAYLEYANAREPVRCIEALDATPKQAA